MFQLDPRYRKMDAVKRARYRKELKFQLIALGAVYIGFSTWWLLISHIAR